MSTRRATATVIPPEGDGITCDLCWDRNHTPENCTRLDLIERYGRTIGSGQGTRQQRNYGGAATESYPTRMASEKQVAYITSLMSERDLDAKNFDGDQVGSMIEIKSGNEIASRDASHLIDGLKAAPFKAREVAAPTGPVEGLDLTSLPAGRYAVPNGETRLKVRIDKPEKGNWAGFVFVKDGAEYGQERRYGMQKPGQAYRGEIESQLRAIVADPQAALAAYWELTSNCGICNRHLEADDSVKRGIGPVCWGKYGSDLA